MALSVRGQLTVSLDDQPPMRLIGDDRWLIIDLEAIPQLPGGGGGNDGGGAKEKGDPGAGAGRRRREMISRVDAMLRRHGVSLEVRIGGNVVARIGPGAKTSLAATLLGLGPIEVHGSGAIKAWLGM